MDIVFEKAVELDWVETIMFPYNIVETQGVEFIKRCGERNIGFIWQYILTMPVQLSQIKKF